MSYRVDTNRVFTSGYKTLNVLFFYQVYNSYFVTFRKFCKTQMFFNCHEIYGDKYG